MINKLIEKESRVRGLINICKNKWETNTNSLCVNLIFTSHTLLV